MTLHLKQTLKSNKNIAIIGAGASGLFAAILLSKKGFEVSIFEKNSKAGRKLQATGNGKCNISNQNLSFEHFHSSNPQFFHYAIDQLSYKKFEELVFSFGLDLQNKNGKIYPKSDQASSVVDVLYSECLNNGVKIYFDTQIISIKKEQNYLLQTTTKQFKSDILIMATGSGAMKKLGSSSSGYEFAQEFGHTIIDPIPSLVQLESDNKKIKLLQGVKTKANVTLKINNQTIKSMYGDILFTKYGVSGDTILDLSKEASIALNNYENVGVEIDIFPDDDKNKLLSILNKKQKFLQNKELKYLLLSLVHSKLIGYILDTSKISKEKVYIKELNKKDILNIIYAMKNIKINITKSRGYEYAEVVSGGIDTNEIDPKSFESKLQKQLYFIGEVLDVDGDCGGYNLHWAWASAYCLAQALN